MIAERPLFRDIGLKVWRLAVDAPVAAKWRPVLFLVIAGRRPLRVGVDILRLGIELDRGLARIAPLQIQPIAFAGVRALVTLRHSGFLPGVRRVGALFFGLLAWRCGLLGSRR